MTTSIRVATYNTAVLDGFIPHARGRLQAIAERLAGLDADLVSLQELWLTDDRAQIAEASGLEYTLAADPLDEGGPGWAADGATGIMLLSRWPIVASSVIALPSHLVRRAVIVAEVESPGGPIAVLSTHLAADIRAVEHPDPGGWQAEHRRHVQAVLRLAAEASGPVILAGDLNCGPEHAGHSPEFAANYDLLRAGFETNAYADDPSSPCTWCPDNPLVTTNGQTIIDHVLESGFRPVSWERIFDEPVDIAGDDGPTTSPLSDHYGVLVTLELD